MRLIQSFCFLSILFLFMLFPVVSFSLTVTSLSDSGTGSLRNAVANTAPGGTVDFAVTGTITLSSEIVIDKDLTIQGPGADLLTISGGNTKRIFFIDPATAHDVVISGLRFVDGNGLGTFLVDTGGAILYFASDPIPEDSRLELNKCVFENNFSDSSGGALSIAGSNAPPRSSIVIINNTTFKTNSSTIGGAIFIQGLNDVKIMNSTFESNSAYCSTSEDGTGCGASGGALANNNAPASSLMIINSTFESNTARCIAEFGDTCNVKGGAFALVPGNPEFDGSTEISFSTFNNNEVIAICNGNVCEASGAIIQIFEVPGFNTPTLMSNIFNTSSLVENCSTTPSPVSLGYNLSNDGTCATGGPGDKPNTNPGLDPLGLRNNGGMTETIALLPGSPAIDMGGPECPPPDTDQRMLPRPRGSACDIGAYEFALSSVPTLSEWGLIAMASVLGIVGFMVMRRRKVAA